MTRVYFKEAVGAFIVFDVTRTATFDAVSKWKQDLDSKVQLPDGNPIPCILLANKVKCTQPRVKINFNFLSNLYSVIFRSKDLCRCQRKWMSNNLCLDLNLFGCLFLSDCCRYCKTNGFAGWFETSAKENTNIEESAKALVSKVRKTIFFKLNNF